jgi:hypothetical protein
MKGEARKRQRFTYGQDKFTKGAALKGIIQEEKVIFFKKIYVMKNIKKRINYSYYPPLSFIY